MRRFSLCFFIVALCAANAFADVSSVSRSVSPVKNKSTISQSENSTVKSRTKRDVSMETRTVSHSQQSGTDAKQTKNTNVVSRSVSQNTNVVTRGGAKVSSRTAVEPVGNVISRTSHTDSKNTAVRRAKITARPETERLHMSSIDTNNRDNLRGIQERAVTLGIKKQSGPTAESITAAKDMLERTADLNSTCQSQYNECMDQFCAVIDANQKRCSCSENLSKYAKVEQAVEDANAELNEVAQNIRYLGLSADEIRAIMNETEAELELTKTKDTSETRSLLDDIADMIKDPTSSTSMSFLSGGDAMFDIDFDFTSESSDLFSLDLFSSTNDISSKRGKELYKEATKRCKTVLKQCKEAGATEAQISGNYDLAISKDCAAYEQGLDNLNKKLLSNVRSANLMLQKGRLSVLQNKNQYDIRGCIAALENCMLDDMVCGDGYLKCLDPTKKYIDENGKVVLGGNIVKITDSMALYDNSRVNTSFIESSMNDLTCDNHDGACIVNYLMNKIGTGQSFKDGGLCRSVLDKCQDYTYISDGKTSTYKPYNEVVVNYIQRAMINIRAAQTKLISDYASSCLADISDCYNQQITQINSLSTTANADSVYSVMTGACYNVALTCGWAVFSYDRGVMTGVAEAISAAGTGGETAGNLYLIQQISDLFYQSLLCPSNSTFQISPSEDGVSPNRTRGGWVNERCLCNSGYTVWGGACVPSCGNGEYRNTLGGCTTCAGTMIGGNANLEPSSCSAVGCPANSNKATEHDAADLDRTIGGYATLACKCKTGYSVWNSGCELSCGANEYRDDSGVCASCDGDVSGGSSSMENNACTLTSDTPAEECSVAHSVYNSTVYSGNVPQENRTKNGYLTSHCRCGTGYTVWNGTCLQTCADNKYRNDNGVCTTCTGTLQGGGKNMESSSCQTSTCTAHSHYVAGTHTVSQNRTIGGYVSSSCQCDDGYTVWNGRCKTSCSSSGYRDNSGNCQTCSGGIERDSGSTKGSSGADSLSTPSDDDFDMERSGCGTIANT